jgi:2-methylcitrate dehydratase PrpD
MFERLASVIVPTSFVAAQRVDCSGATLIRAIAIGGEIGLRTANALGEEHVSRGWDPVGSAGRIGATAAVSVVFGLSSIQIQNALGFASTMSAGIQSGSEALRACIAGKASGDAIEAATLAKYGLIGPPLPLEGRRGLFALVAPSRDPGELVDKLGTRWEHTILFSPGVFADVVDQLVHAPDVTLVSERFAKLTGSSQSA